MRNVSLLFGIVAAVSGVSGQSWPSVSIPKTFKATGTVNTWDGSRLTPFQGASGTLLLDATRNKALVHAKVAVPLFGSIDASLLIDFTTGEALTHVPFLSLCQVDRAGQSLNLTDEFERLNDPAASLTQYLGEISAPWDRLTPSYKFTSKDSFDN